MDLVESDDADCFSQISVGRKDGLTLLICSFLY